MSDLHLLQQIQSYDKEWCYQYQKRLDTFQEDLREYNWTEEDVKNISLDDFKFRYIDSELEKARATEFIKRYEWLGTVGSFPTHWFIATYKGILGGVIIMSMPNSFSKLLGDDTPSLERLISRGASASWCPFNLGSKFLMWAIKWMVDNTQYRLFTCYSDPQARELGSIYQGLNFYYLGQKSGASVRCVNPYNPSVLISDRAFRARSMYKRYAKDLGIRWHSNWSNDQSMLWDNVPAEVETKLRDYSREMYLNSKKIVFPNKHKYAFVLGRDKRETRDLRRLFESLNETYSYPKDRGGWGNDLQDSFGNQISELKLPEKSELVTDSDQLRLFDLV